MDIERIKIIRNSIRENRFQWSAGWTSLSELKDEEQERLLGLIADEKELIKTEAEITEEDARAAAEGISYIYPEKWDWRRVRGRDWTTTVKKQGLCKSCVAFATVAIVESNYEIFKRRPYLNPNLSEADLFFCGGGKFCGRGWMFEPALTYAQEKGIPPEACFPYKSRNVPCQPCENRDRRAVKIKSWRKISSESEAKEWIYRNGPVMTGMAVYEDFYHYRWGIYKYAHGIRRGYHAIALVGYNDRDQYWMCKNSWGTDWGERGWFRIGYGECGIGKKYRFYTAEF